MKQPKPFSVLLLASLLVLSLIPVLNFGLALSPARVHAAQVTPTTVPDNPSCPAGTIALKVEPVADGTYTDGTLTVTIDVRNTADGPVFDFTANLGVDAVIVKGGPDADVYQYDPPSEVTADTALHAPVNPNNNNFYGLSHISFCYDVEPPTATSTSTNTPVPPTVTATNTPTNTSVPPTVTATNTPKTTEEPPTPTNTPTPTPTPTTTEEPTGGNPIGEPDNVQTIYLPLITK
jgi:hypothetical protein